LQRMGRLDNGAQILISEIVAVGEGGVKLPLTPIYFVLN